MWRRLPPCASTSRYGRARLVRGEAWLSTLCASWRGPFNRLRAALRQAQGERDVGQRDLPPFPRCSRTNRPLEAPADPHVYGRGRGTPPHAAAIVDVTHYVLGAMHGRWQVCRSPLLGQQF
jgi:hypothetical protein